MTRWVQAPSTGWPDWAVVSTPRDLKKRKSLFGHFASWMARNVPHLWSRQPIPVIPRNFLRPSYQPSRHRNPSWQPTGILWLGHTAWRRPPSETLECSSGSQRVKAALRATELRPAGPAPHAVSPDRSGISTGSAALLIQNTHHVHAGRTNGGILPPSDWERTSGLSADAVK